MTPYYADEHVTLYHADCREVLPLSADVCITDPPYAIRWALDSCRECGNDDPTGALAICSDCSNLGIETGHRRAEMLGFISPNWADKATHSRGYADHDSEAFAEFLRVAWAGVAQSLSPGGLLISFCGNRTFHEMSAAANGAGFGALDVLVFISNGGVAKSTTTLSPGHELAALMRKPGPVQHINPTWTRGNVYTIDKPGRSESEHLTTKPLTWMRALVDDFTEPGAVVLDPFCGSGSTLRAAKDLGRRAIGIEQNEAYCEIAARRLAQEVFNFGGVA